jgi:hypothetical protein
MLLWGLEKSSKCGGEEVSFISRSAKVKTAWKE